MSPSDPTTRVLAVAGNRLARDRARARGITLDAPAPGDLITGRLRLVGNGRAALAAFLGDRVVGRAEAAGDDRFSLLLDDLPAGFNLIRIAIDDDDSGPSVPLFFVYCETQGQPDSTAAPRLADDPVAVAVAKLFDKWRLPGAVLHSQGDDGATYTQALGFGDVVGGHRMAPDARFRIGSLSKLITAAAVHRLIDQGQLDPGQPINEILNTACAPLTGVTVRHLLCNRSGLALPVDLPVDLAPDWFDPISKTEDANPAHRLTPDQVGAVLAKAQTDSPPGSEFRYMTANYWLLGRVVEACCDGAYADVVKRTLLDPIGLGHLSLGASFPDRRQPFEVIYHGEPGKLIQPVDLLGLDGPVPAAYAASIPLRDAMGGWVMSAPELATFVSHLQDRPPTLLSPQGLSAFLGRPPFAHARTDWYYGQGAFVTAPAGFDPEAGDGWDRVGWWHFGGVDGACGIACRFPGRIVVMLINGTPLNTEVFLAALWSTIAKAIGRKGRT